MAFLVFQRTILDGTPILAPTGDAFRLAGYNLLYRAWESQGRPTDQGWHVDANTLIRLHTNDQHTYATRRLVIDFDPKATWRIGLIEILDVYAYTWQAEVPGQASWTPLMLRLADVLYQEYDHALTPNEKAQIIANLPEPVERSDFVEFLYLTGPSNFGRTGSVNAGFIHNAARTYFRQFF